MLFAACLAVSTPAQATVYRFDYVGQPGDVCVYYCSEFPFTGSLTIDEARLPGGTLAGASLTIGYNASDTFGDGSPFDGPAGSYYYGIVSAAGSFSNLLLPAPAEWPFEFVATTDSPFEFVAFDGIVSEIVHGVYGRSSFEFVFDEHRGIVAWEGASLQGGSNDQITRTTEDFIADGSSAPPGTWHLTAMTPSPVPVPAPLLLLASALGVLFGGRRYFSSRRNRRVGLRRAA